MPIVKLALIMKTVLSRVLIYLGLFLCTCMNDLFSGSRARHENADSGTETMIRYNACNYVMKSPRPSARFISSVNDSTPYKTSIMHIVCSIEIL